MNGLLNEGLPIHVVKGNAALSRHFDIAYLPTFIAISNDKEVDRFSGSTSEAALRDFVGLATTDEPTADDQRTSSIELLAISLNQLRGTPFDQFVATMRLQSLWPASVDALREIAMEEQLASLLRAAVTKSLSVVYTTTGNDQQRKATGETFVELIEGDTPIQIQAYAALGLHGWSSGDERAATVLLRALKEAASEDLRASVIRGLASSPEPTIVQAIGGALRDDSLHVREMAAATLGELGAAAEPALPQLVEAWLDQGLNTRAEAYAALEQLAPSSFGVAKPIGGALVSESVELRRAATSLLQLVPNPHVAGSELVKALSDEDAEVRQTAAALLAESGRYDAAVLPVLIAALKEDVDGESYEIEQSLRQIGRRAVDPLAECLMHAETPTAARIRAAELLGGQGEGARRAMPKLKVALASQNAEVRIAAAAALAWAEPGNKDILPVLENGLQSEDAQLCSLSCRALTNVEHKPDSAVAKLIETLSGDNEQLRYDVGYALSESDVGSQWIPKLVELLDDEQTRPHALRVLGNIKEDAEKVASILASALRDESSDDPHELFYALSRVGKPATAQLLTIIADEDASATARRNAVSAIGQLRSDGVEAADVLRTHIKDPSDALRGQAAIALAALGAADDDVIQVLIEQLASDDGYLASRALSELGSQAKSAADALCEVIEGPNDEAKSTAIDVLGAIAADSDRALATLAKQVHDGDDRVSRQAAQSLVQIGSPATQTIVQIMQDGDKDARVATLAALRWDEQPRETTPVLRQLVLDSDDAVRHRAAILLAHSGTGADNTLRVLLEALNSDDEQLRHDAVYAIGQLGEPAREAVPLIVELLSEPSFGHIAMSALRKLGPVADEAVPALTQRLASPRFYYDAANALGDIGPAAKPAIPDLMEALKYERTMLPAAAALGKIGGESHAAVPILLSNLDDEFLRYAACEALLSVGELAADEVRPALLKAVADADDEMRASAAASLRSCPSPEVVAALSKSLADGNILVAQRAAYSLKQIGNEATAAVPALIATLQTDRTEVRSAALAALGALGRDSDAAVEAVAASLQDEAVRHAAAMAVGDLGDRAKETVSTLISMLDERTTRYAAIEGLRRFGTLAQPALPRLKEIAKDSERYQRRTIENAIRQIEGRDE